MIFDLNKCVENGVERISRVEYENFLSAQARVGAYSFLHNGLCIQIMEALCHIYGFANWDLITVLLKT